MSYFLFSIDSNNQMNISSYPPIANGLKYNSYSTNTTYTTQANALSYFTTATKTALGVVPSINFSNTDFNALDLTYTKSNSIPINFALSFYGYFIPTITGLWTFTFNDDDVISFWISNQPQLISDFLPTLTTSNINNPKLGTAIQANPTLLVYPSFTSNNFNIVSNDFRNGSYSCSASSILNASYDAYTALSGKNSYTSCWISSSSASNGYNTSSGVYSGTVSTLNVYITSSTTSSLAGEWLQIKLPYSLTITNYTLLPRSNFPGGKTAPKNWYIVGSNDGSSWYLLDTKTGIIPVNYSTFQSYDITGQNIPYSYFRFICNANNNNGTDSSPYVSLSQWNINGYPAISTYQTTLTANSIYPMLLNYGQASANAKCQMGITPPGGTISYNGTPYLFN